MVLRSKVEKRNAFTLPDVNDRRHQLENPALRRAPAKPCQDMRLISNWLFFTRRNLNRKFTESPSPHGPIDKDFHHRRRDILSWQEQMSAFHGTQHVCEPDQRVIFLWYIVKCLEENSGLVWSIWQNTPFSSLNCVFVLLFPLSLFPFAWSCALEDTLRGAL